MSKLTVDESIAKSFFEKNGLKVNKIEEGDGERPDFQVNTSQGWCFYSEVKSIDSYPLNEGLLWDDVNRRLSSHIRKALKQFKAVNSL